MKARLVAFGELEIEGERFAHDVVIDVGRVRRRHKGPSKALRDEYGHTPLSAAEAIPWGRRRLIVGTGADGSLPIAPDVYAEAERRGSGSTPSQLAKPVACWAISSRPRSVPSST